MYAGPTRKLFRPATLVALLAAAASASATRAGEELIDREPLKAIVFAVRQSGKDPHWYANFGYFAFDVNRRAWGEGGRLCRLDLATGRLTVLLADARGSVRDPQVLPAAPSGIPSRTALLWARPAWVGVGSAGASPAEGRSGPAIRRTRGRGIVCAPRLPQSLDFPDGVGGS